jgi:hypothetical protein
MLMINLHYAKAFLNPYLLGEVHLHDDANAKEALNKVLRKTICTSTIYALALKDLQILWKVEVHFLTPSSEGPRLAPM